MFEMLTHGKCLLCVNLSTDLVPNPYIVQWNGAFTAHVEQYFPFSKCFFFFFMRHLTSASLIVSTEKSRREITCTYCFLHTYTHKMVDKL